MRALPPCGGSASGCISAICLAAVCLRQRCACSLDAGCAPVRLDTRVRRGHRIQAGAARTLLRCSLCSVAWNHVRAVCITCGQSQSVALKGIEGESGVVKAETCDECHAYAKMLYQAHDMKVDPIADDLATLGLDLLVAEAGWSRPRRIRCR